MQPSLDPVFNNIRHSGFVAIGPFQEIVDIVDCGGIRHANDTGTERPGGLKLN
jgi:hypothetical protein